MIYSYEKIITNKKKRTIKKAKGHLKYIYYYNQTLKNEYNF